MRGTETQRHRHAALQRAEHHPASQRDRTRLRHHAAAGRRTAAAPRRAPLPSYGADQQRGTGSPRCSGTSASIAVAAVRWTRQGQGQPHGSQTAADGNRRARRAAPAARPLRSRSARPRLISLPVPAVVGTATIGRHGAAGSLRVLAPGIANLANGPGRRHATMRHCFCGVNDRTAAQGRRPRRTRRMRYSDAACPHDRLGGMGRHVEEHGRR